MNEAPEDHVEISGLDTGPVSAESESSTPNRAARPWVGIRFDCCGVYTRVYRNQLATAYRGCCPRCGRPVTLRVGEGGTSARFFVAE